MCCGNTGIYINANKNHKHKKRVILSNIKAKTRKPHKLFLVFIWGCLFVSLLRQVFTVYP